MPAHAFVPTDEHRQIVLNGVTAGVPQSLMCKILGIAEPTLRKYFVDELETAVASRNIKAVSYLWQHIENGDKASLMFYMKTQMGWRETNKIEVDATVDIKGAGVSGLLATVLKKDAKA